MKYVQIADPLQLTPCWPEAGAQLLIHGVANLRLISVQSVRSVFNQTGAPIKYRLNALEQDISVSFDCTSASADARLSLTSRLNKEESLSSGINSVSHFGVVIVNKINCNKNECLLGLYPGWCLSCTLPEPIFQHDSLPVKAAVWSVQMGFVSVADCQQRTQDEPESATEGSDTA